MGSLKKIRIETIVNAVLLEVLECEKVVLRFAVIEEGNKAPVIIDDKKVCKIINKKQAMQRIKNIAAPLCRDYEGSISNPEAFILTASTAAQIFDSMEISQSVQLREKVKPFCFLSDDSHTFCRIPFDHIPGSVIPDNWEILLDNFSNRAALCMWIGSLFFEDSDRSQYLWLYGRGGNGKSTLSRVISKILGSFVRFEQAPGKDDKYWTNGLIGKRLIVIDDCNNYGFVKTGLFKSLTGSSKVRVEAKYGNPYDTDLECKFLFTSNELPMVSDEIADQRRLIFSSAKNKEKFDFAKDFEKNLESNLPDFISACMDMYLSACSDGRPIPVDQAESLELGDIFNEEIAAWVDSIGEFDADSKTSMIDFRNALNLTKLSYRNVYKYLESAGVERKQIKIAGRNCRVLTGFRIKLFSGRF